MVGTSGRAAERLPVLTASASSCPPRICPTADGCPPFYFGGLSEAAREVAAQAADVFLMWPDTLDGVDVVVGTGTTIIPGDGLLATPGTVDTQTLIPTWIENSAKQKQILVDNPRRLYRFSA